MIPAERLKRFNVNQVWATSQGSLWRCLEVGSKVAVFRHGLNGKGPLKRIPSVAVTNWKLYFDPAYPDYG